eukprot:6173120-Pleurochrysis_carterae.AAC.1
MPQLAPRQHRQRPRRQRGCRAPARCRHSPRRCRHSPRRCRLPTQQPPARRLLNAITAADDATVLLSCVSAACGRWVRGSLCLLIAALVALVALVAALLVAPPDRVRVQRVLGAALVELLPALAQAPLRTQARTRRLVVRQLALQQLGMRRLYLRDHALNRLLRNTARTVPRHCTEARSNTAPSPLGSCKSVKRTWLCEGFASGVKRRVRALCSRRRLNLTASSSRCSTSSSARSSDSRSRSRDCEHTGGTVPRRHGITATLYHGDTSRETAPS